MDAVGSDADFSTDPKFVTAMANKVYYGTVYFRSESEPYMTLALARAFGHAGVSVAEINLKFIWNLVSQVKVGQEGRAYVVDAQGRLIAHPDMSLVLRKIDLSGLVQVQAAQAIAGAVPSDPLQVAKDIQGRRVLTTYAPIPPVGWLVFVELPVDEAYRPLYATIGRMTLLLLAGCSSPAWWSGRSTRCRPSLPASTAGISANELEMLADQLNEMAGKLHQS